MRLTEKPTQPHLTTPRPAVAAGAFCEHPIDAARIETKHEGNDDSENGPGQPAGAFSMAEHGACCIAEAGHKGYIFVPPQNTVGSRVVAHVLCTGADHTLLHTRKLILEHAGHTVVSASSEPEVREACAQRQIDVAVIGQSVSAPQKQRVFALVREACPTAKILELVPPYSTKALHGADDWLEAPMEVPHEFVEKVAKLARRSKRREAG